MAWQEQKGKRRKGRPIENDSSAQSREWQQGRRKRVTAARKSTTLQQHEKVARAAALGIGLVEKRERKERIQSSRVKRQKQDGRKVRTCNRIEKKRRKRKRKERERERCRNTDNTGNIEFFGKGKRWRWIKAGKKRGRCLRKVRKQLKHWIKKGKDENKIEKLGKEIKKGFKMMLERMNEFQKSGKNMKKEMEMMKRKYREQMVKQGRKQLRKEIGQMGQRIKELERIASRKEIEKDNERGENEGIENRLKKVEKMLEKKGEKKK